jgi:predicted amidohydrolase YtcJ
LDEIVVLSEDFMTVAPEKIRDSRVDLTIIGGKIVHEFAERGQ